jgi:hypothetical protein|nr:MAG TPA: hypothetical protein [Caudoviricetes sp.]
MPANLGPVITLYNEANTSTVDTWSVGTVKAQEPSAALVVNIWNNRGNNTEDHSDLRECTLTVLDANGNTATEDVARDKWVECKMKAESDWMKIGGSGSAFASKKVTANTATAGEGILKGTMNDGQLDTSGANVATVSFRINAPINSTPGNKSFKIRLTGYYT